MSAAAEQSATGRVYHSFSSLLRFTHGEVVEIDGVVHRAGHFGLTPATICRSHRFTSQLEMPQLKVGDVTCMGCQIVERAGGVVVRSGPDKRYWPGGRGAHAYANGAGR